MAEIHTNHNNKKGSRTNRSSVSIDMTAMVDVAFLMLTFFVLTATMKEDRIQEIIMPPKLNEEPVQTEVLEEKVLTLILKEDDRIAYFFGAEGTHQDLTYYSPNGVRKVLLDHLQNGVRTMGLPLCEKAEENEPCWDPMIVVRPMPNSRYKNLVDILDELTITSAPKYAIDNSKL